LRIAFPRVASTEVWRSRTRLRWLRACRHKSQRRETSCQLRLDTVRCDCYPRHILLIMAVRKEEGCGRQKVRQGCEESLRGTMLTFTTREMQLFLLGYLIIEICEIFTVGGFPLDGAVRRVRASSPNITSTSDKSIVGILRRTHSLCRRDVMGTSTQWCCRLSIAGRWHSRVAWLDSCLSSRPLHRYWLHCPGHCL
jgi:hypothetical protein